MYKPHCVKDLRWRRKRRDLWYTTIYYGAEHNGTIKGRKWSGNSVLHAAVIHPSEGKTSTSSAYTDLESER